MTAEAVHRPPTSKAAPSVTDSPAMAYFKPALSEILFGCMRFLISDKPTESTLDNFVRELHRHSVKVLVRVCEPSYSIKLVEERGVKVIDWQFEDGSPPPQEIIDKWITLVKETFDPKG